VEEKFDIRSNEVQELIGAVPTWIVRWGSTVVLLVLAGLLAFSYIIKYPDVVSAPVIISTSTPPIPMIAKTSGKLTHLLVKDNESVDSNQLVGVIESVADYTYVLYLDSLLDDDSILLRETLQQLDPKKQMGELQADYSQFLNSMQDQDLFALSNYKDQQINKIRESIVFQNELIASYKRQIASIRKELNNAELKYSNDLKLYQKGIISTRELQESESSSIRLQNQIQSMNANISNGQMSIANFEKQLTDVNVMDAQNSLDKKSSIIENFNNLRSKIKSWKNTFLITSPAKGSVSFNTIRNENQFVEIGKTVLSIVQKNDFFIGQIMLPTQNAGKVKKGQRVMIKLDNYPYQEFGTLDAVIENISSVPVDGKYIVEVSLPKMNETSYHKQLSMQQDMRGVADIITDKKRLITKFFDKLKYLFNDRI
jgi:multidrug resistance efflux pump